MDASLVSSLVSHVRVPFAAAFGILLLGLGYLGFVPSSNPTPVNDKALHFLAFFILTLVGYWTFDVHRRILLKIVPIVALVADVGSEFLQVVVNPQREFDLIDIAANVIGSFAAIALSAWYHRRMLERKRRRKMQGYGLVTGDDVADIELGEGSGEQEVGVVDNEDDEEGGEAWDAMDDGEPSEPRASEHESNGQAKD